MADGGPRTSNDVRVPHPELAHYSSGANDLGRFRGDPADAAIEAFVEKASHEVVAQFGEDDFYTLLLFARRAAARALRQGDLRTATSAIRALMLVDRDRIDFRDLSVDFPLYAVRELGGDVRAQIDLAVRHSSSGTAEAFEAARRRAKRVSLRDCALVQISTSYGIGFIDDLTGARRPPVSLAQAVVPLLDLIDEEGAYRTGDLSVSALPGVWFGQRDVMRIAVDGCVSFSGDHIQSTHPYSHTLLVFVADFRKEREAERLASAASDASTAERPRHAVAVGRRLALFIGGSATMNEDALETSDGLQRFSRLASGMP
jgi:hypothetical protein